jgi:hypothetical protein
MKAPSCLLVPTAARWFAGTPALRVPVRHSSMALRFPELHSGGCDIAVLDAQLVMENGMLCVTDRPVALAVTVAVADAHVVWTLQVQV